MGKTDKGESNRYTDTTFQVGICAVNNIEQVMRIEETEWGKDHERPLLAGDMGAGAPTQ